MRILAAAFLCATAGIAAGQFADPCKTKTRTSAHEDQCDLYYECFNGQPVLQECPNGLVYHGKRTQGLFGVCDYDFMVDCTGRPARSYAQHLDQPNPCDYKSGIIGDITYCDRYWECVVGNPQLYDCPNGLVFVGRNRGIAEGCDYPWRGAYCDDKQLANPPISGDHCDWLYGIFGHETSCTRYWTCWNGTAAEQFCIGGLLYNEESHSCDWPQNVAGCQKHPLCKDDPNANVPLGKSCERYWACQGGYPRLQRCPATLVFDKRSRRCVNPPTEDCEAPTIAPAPEGFDDDADFRGGAPPPPRRRRPSSSLSQGSQDQGSFLPNNALSFRPSSPSDSRPSGPPLPQGGNFREAPIDKAVPLN